MGGCTAAVESTLYRDVLRGDRVSPEHKEHFEKSRAEFELRWGVISATAKERLMAISDLPLHKRLVEKRALHAWVCWQIALWQRERSGASCP